VIAWWIGIGAKVDEVELATAEEMVDGMEVDEEEEVVDDIGRELWLCYHVNMNGIPPDHPQCRSPHIYRWIIHGRLHATYSTQIGRRHRSKYR
jgi:hypothetical protein